MSAEFAARLSAALAGAPQPAETPAPIETERTEQHRRQGADPPAEPDWVARMFTAHANHQRPAPAPTEPPKPAAAERPDIVRQAFDAKRAQQTALAARFGLASTKKD